MEGFTGHFTSKLPDVSTTIFTVMSKLAEDHEAINLSQGFPDFGISEELIALVNKYMLEGYNQYAPMAGVPALRKAIAGKVFSSYGIVYDPDKEINITPGATCGIYTALSAFVREGDEVIVFDPAYDSYDPAVRVNGGVAMHASLKFPDFHIDWEEVGGMISERTRMIIINSPHNPTGSILHADDLQTLEDLTRGKNILVISDEVYEHLVFDGNRHESICLYPELARRSFIVYSFGKTFHATGWKIGYVLAPENLMKEFRKVFQFNVFTCNTPVQYALAEFLQEKNYRGLGSFYQAKRDYFIDKIRDSRFRVIPSYGTYFQLLDYSAITREPEMDFAVRMTKEYGLASIPVSAFYQDHQDNHILRFCFAKKEETLARAAGILCRL